MSEQDKLIVDIINWYYNSSEQIFQYSGAAGTGKTYVMSKVIEALELGIEDIAPMAYVGAAAIVMRMRGLINAKTIHSWIYDAVYEDDHSEMDPILNRPKKKLVFIKKENLPNIKLILIDEGSQVPMSMKADLLSFGIKILVCGDLNQLPPVEDAPAFFLSGHVSYLTKIWRQSENSGIVFLAHEILNGHKLEIGNYGNAAVVSDSDMTDSAILAADMVICAYNATRDHFNNYIRSILKGIKSTLPVQGDKMICRMNNWEIMNDEGISLANGLTGTVVNSSDIHNFDGTKYMIDFLPNFGSIPFRSIKCDFRYLLADVDIRRRIKHERMTLRKKGNKFEYAYAISTHISQGSQYRKGIYYKEKWKRREEEIHLDYTGITRFSHGCVVVLPSKRYY